MKNTVEKEYLTMEEVVNRYQIKRGTIYSWVRKGTIPFTKFGELLRFPKNLLDKWDAARTSTPALLKGMN